VPLLAYPQTGSRFTTKFTKRTQPESNKSVIYNDILLRILQHEATRRGLPPSSPRCSGWCSGVHSRTAGIRSRAGQGGALRRAFASTGATVRWRWCATDLSQGGRDVRWAVLIWESQYRAALHDPSATGDCQNDESSSGELALLLPALSRRQGLLAVTQWVAVSPVLS